MESLPDRNDKRNDLSSTATRLRKNRLIHQMISSPGPSSVWAEISSFVTLVVTIRRRLSAMIRLRETQQRCRARRLLPIDVWLGSFYASSMEDTIVMNKRGLPLRFLHLLIA